MKIMADRTMNIVFFTAFAAWVLLVLPFQSPAHQRVFVKQVIPEPLRDADWNVVLFGGIAFLAVAYFARDALWWRLTSLPTRAKEGVRGGDYVQWGRTVYRVTEAALPGGAGQSVLGDVFTIRRGGSVCM